MPTEPNKPMPPRPPGIYRALAVVMHPLERLLGLGCRTFTRLASARMDRALTLRERVRYTLHWFMCSICRQQAARSLCLHQLLKLGHGETLSEAKLSAEAKAKLRERVQAELKLES